MRLNVDFLAAMVAEYGARLAGHRISIPKVPDFHLNNALLLHLVETKSWLVVFLELLNGGRKNVQYFTISVRINRAVEDEGTDDSML